MLTNDTGRLEDMHIYWENLESNYYFDDVLSFITKWITRIIALIEGGIPGV